MNLWETDSSPPCCHQPIFLSITVRTILGDIEGLLPLKALQYPKSGLLFQRSGQACYRRLPSFLLEVLRLELETFYFSGLNLKNARL